MELTDVSTDAIVGGAKQKQTRMWANAQRDGRPAEYRWRPLFNGAKFGWRPLLECRAVTKPRRETRWNLLGCPKQPNRSQPLVGQSSPYCEDMWGRYCCLARFFSDCRYVPYLRRYTLTKLYDGAQMGNFCPVLSASHVQNISDLHLKFVLRPHHVWKYGRHPVCDSNKMGFSTEDLVSIKVLHQ